LHDGLALARLDVIPLQTAVEVWPPLEAALPEATIESASPLFVSV